MMRKRKAVDLSKELPDELFLDYSKTLPNRFASQSAKKKKPTMMKVFKKKAMRPKSNREGVLPAEVDFDFLKARPNRFGKR